MSPSRKILRALGPSVLFWLSGLALQAQGSRAAGADTLAPLAFPLVDTLELDARNVKVEAVDYLGRKAVRLSVVERGEATDGLAFLRGVEFADGTIEADVALKVTTPAGIRNPGFIGVAFRSRSDASHYDLFYIRPGNSGAPDQAMRNHSVQYVAKPGFGWPKLRRAWPWVYEAYAELQPEMWTRIKIEVEGRGAKLYVNGAANPALIVDGLKGEDLKGGVGLWGFPGQESYFSNVRIIPAKRQPIENGSEADGGWKITYATDSGPFSGELKLHREGTIISGTASGLLGADLPVTGTWRNGYVELTFNGTWPGRGASAGPATANIAGWIDGAGAKGRLSINGYADGVWTATKKE